MSSNKQRVGRRTANVYVDGFNPYYGALKGTSHKWLDLDALFRTLVPTHEIKRIRYFTARMSARPDTRTALHARTRTCVPTGPCRTYQSTSEKFLQSNLRMPLANPKQGGPKTVEVVKTEEKGSDVNLATYLLIDAFRHDSDLAVVVSNDSDLCEPIRIVNHEFGVPVALLIPHNRTSQALSKLKPAFIKQIRSGPLSASQFPRS